MTVGEFILSHHTSYDDITVKCIRTGRCFTLSEITNDHPEVWDVPYISSVSGGGTDYCEERWLVIRCDC